MENRNFDSTQRYAMQYHHSKAVNHSTLNWIAFKLTYTQDITIIILLNVAIIISKIQICSFS